MMLNSSQSRLWSVALIAACTLILTVLVWKNWSTFNVETWQVSKDKSDLINRRRGIFPAGASPPSISSFLMADNELCSRVQTLKFVVVVHSAPDHFLRRSSMRQTWAKNDIVKGIQSRTVFIVGTTADVLVKKNLVNEFNTYGDIVQGDFVDDYRNLTLKAVFALKWLEEKCKNAQFVVKVDDDVFINIFELKAVFNKLSLQENGIVCYVEPQGHIFRNEQDVPKWGVSQEYFTDFKIYPIPFCYGFAVFLPRSLTSKLFALARITPFYRLDDVYIYGILASQVEGITWKTEAKRSFKEESFTGNTILYQDAQNLLVGSPFSVETMHMYWRAINLKSGDKQTLDMEDDDRKDV